MIPLPNYLQYRITLYRISQKEARLARDAPPESQEAYDYGRLNDYQRQEEQLYIWKALTMTRYLEKKADRLLVPLPDRNDKELYGRVDWDDDYRQPHYLTLKGIYVVRELIRTERRHARELVGYWFGIIVGVVGALTGLVSVIYGR